ncbi:MAG: transposase, partial [Alphaproteobacteria bacterium]
NANLVFKWLRDPRFNPPSDDGLNGSFLPVEVVAAPPAIHPPVIDASIVETPVISSGASGSQVEIVLPTGHRISVSGAYDPDALCRLVRGLAS